jgi:hypothetical protein
VAIMRGNLYAALRSANVPDDKAREAAEEVAEFKDGLADVKSTQRLHTWILTFNTAMTVAIIGKLFLGH